MKTIFTALVLCAVALLAASPGQLFAQSDTIWVAASPAGNINDFIGGDTLADGSRAHANAIYALYRDSLYFYTATLESKGPLTIVAPDGAGAPPVIASAVLPDGSTVWTFLNSDKGNLTLKNLYLLGVGPNNQWLGWGSAVNINGDSSKVVVDGCVFDEWSDGAVDQNGSWDSFWFTNNYFINDIHSSSYFGGHDWESHGVPTDTIIMVNNTMFNDNSYSYCPTGYVRFNRFEHNTVCLNMVNPQNDFFGTNEIVSNNIFYSTLMIGQQIDEAYGAWYDTVPYKSFAWSGSSTISLDTLGLLNWIAQYPAEHLSDATRKVLIHNNAYFWPSQVVNFWTAYNDTVTKKVAVSYSDSSFNPSHGPHDTLLVNDTIKAILVPPAGWMNGRTQGMFSNKTMFPGLSAWANDSVDPGFPSFVSNQIDSALKYVVAIRAGLYPGFMWDYTAGQPMFSWLWPLPNLAYSNVSLQTAGSDGYALGDLNQFPTQKAAWLAAGGLGLGVKPQVVSVPGKFELRNNYPNPFNPTTTISFTLNATGPASLKIYNVLGQLVMTVDEGVRNAGQLYTFNVNMDRFSSGVYFYTLQQATNSITKKMLLLK
ncbi:MAG TPA: T9SS type A sorting domain-containing protein [Candidatus Kryptonia bacterium]